MPSLVNVVLTEALNKFKLVLGSAAIKIITRYSYIAHPRGRFADSDVSNPRQCRIFSCSSEVAVHMFENVFLFADGLQFVLSSLGTV